MFTNLSNLKKAALFSIIVFFIASVFGVLKIRAELYMFAPLLSVIIMMFIITRDGYSKKGWSLLGLHRTGKKMWLFAIFVPVVYLIASYFLLWATPFASFNVIEGLDTTFWLTFPLKIFIALVIYTITSSLGEELGWRGYLLPRLLHMGWKKALIVTGFVHATFHFPIIFSGLYHPEGNPWVVFPQMIICGVLVGILFGYVTLKTKSVWPAALRHAAHNISWAELRALTEIKSEMAHYVGGEFGLFTMILYGIIAFWIFKKGHIGIEKTNQTTARGNLHV